MTVLTYVVTVAVVYFISCFTYYQYQYPRHVHANPIQRTESGMISFFGLHFFSFCPSRFEVDLSRFFQAG